MGRAEKKKITDTHLQNVEHELNAECHPHFLENVDVLVNVNEVSERSVTTGWSCPELL